MLPHHAVLTGDLIASSAASLDVVDSAMATLAESATVLGGLVQQDTRFTRHRGDGWHMYLGDPGFALRGCLFVTARLRAKPFGLGTRISVGLGTVERLNPGGLSDASGDAFTVSGRGLDRMPRSKRLTIDGRGLVTPWHTAVFDLVEWQSGRWSREQAEAVALALATEAPTQAELAAKLGITRQALQARLRGAGFGAMASALAAFERTEFLLEVPR